MHDREIKKLWVKSNISVIDTNSLTRLYRTSVPHVCQQGWACLVATQYNSKNSKSGAREVKPATIST